MATIETDSSTRVSFEAVGQCVERLVEARALAVQTFGEYLAESAMERYAFVKIQRKTEISFAEWSRPLGIDQMVDGDAQQSLYTHICKMSADEVAHVLVVTEAILRTRETMHSGHRLNFSIQFRAQKHYGS